VTLSQLSQPPPSYYLSDVWWEAGQNPLRVVEPIEEDVWWGAEIMTFLHTQLAPAFRESNSNFFHQLGYNP
jgi:hypothetical protein